MTTVAPRSVGSPGPPGVGTAMRFACVSSLVDDLNESLREAGCTGGVASSFKESDVVCTSVKSDTVVLVVLEDGTGVIHVVDVDVVVLAPGKLSGSAGSVFESTSSVSGKPSSSRSMPMRMPEPGGAQV